jgi:hypothetical protein
MQMVQKHILRFCSPPKKIYAWPQMWFVPFGKPVSSADVICILTAFDLTGCRCFQPFSLPFHYSNFPADSFPLFKNFPCSLQHGEHNIAPSKLRGIASALVTQDSTTRNGTTSQPSLGAFPALAQILGPEWYVLLIEIGYIMFSETKL